MTLSLPTPLNIPTPPTRYPSPAQLLLFFLLLGWLAAAPIGLGIVTAFLPPWPILARHALALILLAGLLLIPFSGFAFLTRRQGWGGSRPLALILLGVGLYISIDAVVRAIGGPGSAEATHLLPLRGTILRLTLLTLAALLLGAAGLWWVGLPQSRRELSRALGLSAPKLVGLLLALAGVAILTIGWPLTGASGWPCSAAGTWSSGLQPPNTSRSCASGPSCSIPPPACRNETPKSPRWRHCWAIIERRRSVSAGRRRSAHRRERSNVRRHKPGGPTCGRRSWHGIAR